MIYLLGKDIETIYLTSSTGLNNIKSSLVKELFQYNVDISSLVTDNVLERMLSKK